MDFENKVPEWKNAGAEPSQELKTNGVTAGYKPPANLFNWFFSLVSKAITELQNKLNGHATAQNPHNITAEGINAAKKDLSNVDNTTLANKLGGSFENYVKKTDVIAVEKGGTNATTAEEARANLGAAYTFYKEVVVSNEGWAQANTAYRKLVAVEGLLDTDTPIVDVVTTQADTEANKLTLEAWSHIVTVTTAGDGQVNIFTDGEIPAVTFTMKVKVVR